MAGPVTFTSSRPLARRQGSRAEAVPSEPIEIKQEHPEDDWHPTSSASYTPFGTALENPVVIDDDDSVRIKEEDDEGQSRPIAPRGNPLFGNAQRNPLVLDDDGHVEIKQEDKDDSFFSADAWGGCGLTQKDPILLDDDDFKIKQENDDDFISTDAWGGCGLSHGDPVLLDDDDDVNVKEEENDKDFISTDAWGGCGLSQGDPIALEDDHQLSNFLPARVESAPTSEMDFSSEVPRNSNHILSSASRSHSRSCSADPVVPSVEAHQDFVLHEQTSAVSEAMEDGGDVDGTEVDPADFDSGGFDAVDFDAADVDAADFDAADFDAANVDMDLLPSNEHEAVMTFGQTGHTDSGDAASEIQGNMGSLAATEGAEPDQEAEEESPRSNQSRFALALKVVRSGANTSVKRCPEETTDSKVAKKESSNPPSDEIPARPQATDQLQDPLTTPLTNESQLNSHDHDARAKREFDDFENAYLVRKKAHETSMDEDIEYIRRSFKENARRRRVAEEARQIPSPEPEPDARNENWNGRARYPEESLFCTPPPPKENRKRLSPIEDDGVAGGNDQGYFDNLKETVQNESESEVEPARSRKRAKKTDNAENALSEALTTKRKRSGRPVDVKNGQGKGKKKGVPKGKGRGRNADAVPRNRLLDTASLLTSDAIRDANANEAEPATYYDDDQEGTRNKQEALKRLIASVPLDKKKTAQMDKKDLLEATKSFQGQGACRADGKGDWLVTGMKSSLRNYQVLGAGFMRSREHGEDLPLGGLCSDHMGFGKTVMTLANIVNDHVWRRRIRFEGPRTTLIVVPSTLVAQWKSEIDKHVKVKENKMKVMTYRSGSRPDSNDGIESISGYDIVITTYYELMASFPKADVPLDLQTSQEKHEWWQKFFDENKGLLHRVKYRRIVLDEAQQIKNHKGRTSMACRQLNADFRWTLSGTPITNTPLELYAFFKFLQVPFTGSFRVFKDNYYGDNDAAKLKRLEVMLDKFMIRRTHKDTLFLAPILKLPRASEYTHVCQFNDTERAVYEIVRKRMIARINAFSRDNTLQRNYSNVLVMLLRLRQMTGNLLLIETVMRDLLEREDHEKLVQLTKIEARIGEHREAQIIGLRRILAENSIDDPDDPSSSSQNGTQQLPDQDELVNLGSTHGLSYNFNKYLISLRQGKAWEELQARTLCSECRNPPEDPMVTSCYHIYCKTCLELVQHRAAMKGLEHARCTECQNEYSKAVPCDDYSLESVIQSQEVESDNEEGPTNKHWKRKKRGKKGKDDEEVVSSWINMHGSVLPSAKTIAIKAQILNWLEANPNCKIIVYTQFLTMIRILAKVCNQEGWGYVEFHGKMSLNSRDATIQRFTDEPDSKIMLASLKCGGIGLNLTMASHVISIDPWWNAAVEQQAFGRIFRIGQTAVTTMTKFVVEGTIDEQLIAMQKRKQAQIDSVMGDNKNSGKKLTIRDMMRLFGPVEEDGAGKPFIVVENKDTVPRFNQDSEDEGDED